MRTFARKLITGLLLGAPFCLVLPAAAQDSVTLNESLSDGSNLPFERRSTELAAMGMLLEFRGQKLQGQRCFDTGCLFIINQTSDYDAVGLYLDIGSPDPEDAPVWSPNLFRDKLRPRLARWTYKAGDASMCTLGTKVVLRHRRTHEEITTYGALSLCKTPHVDSSFRINVVEARVKVESEKGGR